MRRVRKNPTYHTYQNLLKQYTNVTWHEKQQNFFYRLQNTKLSETYFSLSLFSHAFKFKNRYQSSKIANPFIKCEW